jgi:hypothetical protein
MSSFGKKTVSGEENGVRNLFSSGRVGQKVIMGRKPKTRKPGDKPGPEKGFLTPFFSP